MGGLMVDLWKTPRHGRRRPSLTRRASPIGSEACTLLRASWPHRNMRSTPSRTSTHARSLTRPRSARLPGVADSLFGEAACDHAGDGDELVGAVWTWALLGLRDTASASGRVARPERRTGCDANGRARPARCVPCGERWQRHRSPLADRSDASRVTRSISPGALDWRVAQPKPPGRFRLASGSIDGRSP